MLSLHPRAVTEKNFTILIKNYEESNSNRFKALDTIVNPLIDMGLIEELSDTSGLLVYTAHPLMKLSFNTWLDSKSKREAHEQWAEAAMASPDVSEWAEHATSIEELQPYLDIVEHYLEAGKPDEAWGIYRGRNVDNSLLSLGHAHRLLEIGRRFEEEIEQQRWSPEPGQCVHIYALIAHGFNTLRNQPGEFYKYMKKMFEAAKKAGNKRTILINGAFMAASCLYTGRINEARETLAQLKPVASEVETGTEITHYQLSLATTELFSGNYQRAVSLFRQDTSQLNVWSQIISHRLLTLTLIRSNQFSEAEKLLNKSLSLAEKNHIINLKSSILSNFTLLCLKQNNIAEARIYNDQAVEIQKSLDLPHEDYGYLLVKEGKYDQAISQAIKYISDEEEEKFDKWFEIHNLLILAYAWYGKGSEDKARQYISHAESLMNETGCWVFKDMYEEIEAMIDIRS